MKITIFSGNQPRHLSLAKSFSQISERVFFVSEVSTVFPGMVADRLQKSPTMQLYFENVRSAEKNIFGDIQFLPANVRTLSIKSGDLSYLQKSQLSEALEADFFIVFGASFIKGWLMDFLFSRKAINIHMGLSPYYRGAACNFWAVYDRNLGYVGATIHLLSKGLDSGDILFHCLPNLQVGDTSFDFTMRAVLVAHNRLAESLENEEIWNFRAVPQDLSKIVRYSRNKDFTDEKALEFLKRDEELELVDCIYPELICPKLGSG